MISDLGAQRPTRAFGGDAGFTLVEIAIVLVIIGIAMSGTLLCVNQYIKGEKIRVTHQKIDYVMNELSAYAQTHYRLPCPADPGAPAATLGHEVDSGQCFRNANNQAMYWETEGIVPWKELGISQDMVVDGWGRYLTYRPAPNLTVDNNSNTATGQAEQDIPNSSGVTGPGTPDIHNACRTAMWFDAFGNHVNRAKALFCCDAQPKMAYLTTVVPAQPTTFDPNWRHVGVVDTTTAAGTPTSATGSLPAATAVAATPAWNDDSVSPTVNGAFNFPLYNDNTHAQPPLLRATGPAVTLISHGGDGSLAFLPEQAKTNLLGGSLTEGGGVSGSGYADGEAKNVWPAQMFAAVFGHPKVNDGSFDLLNGDATASDDIVSYLRTDQIFARVGNGSCQYPPNAISPGGTYNCIPQPITNPQPGVIDPKNGYGLQLLIASSQKYKLSASFMKTSANPDEVFHHSLGFYTIGSDGTIGNATILSSDTKPLAVGDKTSSTPVDLDTSSPTVGIGVFLITDGGTLNNFSNPAGANYIGGDSLQFKNQTTGAAATIYDTTTPLLYAVDASGDQTPVYGREGYGGGPSTTQGIAHMNSNLNYGQVSHALTDDKVCSVSAGGVITRAKYNSALPCYNSGNPGGHVTALQQVGALSGDNTKLQMGFEALENVDTNCYADAAGNCTSNKANAVQDSYGGYIASVGDNTYDDVSFKLSMTACPEGQ